MTKKGHRKGSLKILEATGGREMYEGGLRMEIIQFVWMKKNC